MPGKIDSLEPITWCICKMKWTLYPVSEFGSYAAMWDVLNVSGSNSPLLSSHFLIASLQAFKSGEEKLAIWGDPAQPDAMCILVQRGKLVWNTFQPAQAPIGFWLMRPGINLEDGLTDLLHALPGLSLAVGITQQDPLLVPRPSNSARMLTFNYIDTMHIELNVDYGSYWQARGKNLRQNMRTAHNRLAKKGLAYRITRIADPGKISSYVENFARMESSGWKAKEGTAVQFDSTQGKFYVNLLQSFCLLGSGCIYSLTFDDVIVAMDLCIHQGGAVIVLKTTYDENYKEYSPAMLLHQELLRILTQSGDFQRLEFYGRAREWQLRLTGETRTMYHVNLYRWEWLRRGMQNRIESSQ